VIFWKVFFWTLGAFVVVALVVMIHTHSRVVLV
jgi:hypothetical protein